MNTMNDSATEQRPTKVPDLLAAASTLVADGLDPEAAIHTAAYGSPEIRTGSPLTAAAKTVLIAAIDEELRPEYPATYPGTVLAHWADQVPPEDVAATMRRVAAEQRQ